MIRVLFANLPQMLGEIAARFIDRQADMEVIRCASTDKSAPTPAQVAALGADVLIVTPAGDARAAAAGYLEAQPGLQIICVAEDGRSALRYYAAGSRVAGSETLETSVTIVEESLVDLNVNRLVQVMRGA